MFCKSLFWSEPEEFQYNYCEFFVFRLCSKNTECTSTFAPLLKFMFSKKVAKFDEIFTVNLTLCSKCQIDSEDFFNFCGLHRKHELDQPTFITFPNLSIILNYNFDFEVVGSKTFYLQTLQPEII